MLTLIFTSAAILKKSAQAKLTQTTGKLTTFEQISNLSLGLLGFVVSQSTRNNFYAKLGLTQYNKVYVTNWVLEFNNVQFESSILWKNVFILNQVTDPSSPKFVTRSGRRRLDRGYVHWNGLEREVVLANLEEVMTLNDNHTYPSYYRKFSGLVRYFGE